MIVKITYSVYLEEVPMEVSKLVDELEKEFKKISKNLNIASDELCSNEEDVRTPMAKIEHTMKLVEKLQSKLKDCHAILDGYSRVKDKDKIPPPNPLM
jgi:ribosome recycling factor